MAAVSRLPLLGQVMPQVARLIRLHKRLGLVFIDLVDFTSFQEQHGSRAGDRVLAAMGRVLREQRFALGQTTGILPSTLGGDDFLLFFPDPGPRHALASQFRELHRLVQERLNEVTNGKRAGRTGPPLRVHLGYAEVVPGPERRPEMCVYEAVKEAALMAKSGMDLADFLSRDEILTIIREERVHAVYQPIVSLRDASVLGYEALARGPADSRFASPLALFDMAARHLLLFRLEALCRKRAIEGARAFLHGQKLFLNVDPRVIQDPDFRAGTTRVLLEQAGLTPEDVVLELTERSAIGDYAGFREALAHYRRQGYTLAIDDVGSGYSSLQAIVELQPLYVKIDRSLTEGVHDHPAKRAMVRALTHLARELHCYTIAEGVEHLEELDFLVEAGADYAQGYLLGVPAAPPPSPPPRVLARLRSAASGRPPQARDGAGPGRSARRIPLPGCDPAGAIC